jgi:hypothetical protein
VPDRLVSRTTAGATKHRRRDSVRDSQRHWLNGAIAIGIAVDPLMIVEWDFRGCVSPGQPFG